jgi:MFS transporter, PAT family, beta-lactamase induction signal transducer AmpG
MNKANHQRILQSPHVWTLTTYFAEGFPYTVIRIISSVFFRDMRVGLGGIGLTSLFGLAWVLKFLWGPQVDLYGTKRTWMLSTQASLVCMILGAALLSCLPHGVTTIAILFFLGSFIAATHDIAIDGYYMEALDEKGQARFVGYRVMAYRIAMMTGTGIVVSIGASTSWLLGFASAGALLGLLFLYHLTLLPRIEENGEPYSDLFKKALKPKTTLGVLVALLLLIAIGWSFYRGWPQWATDEGSPLSRISLSGWIGILLLLGLCALAFLKNRIKRMLLRDQGSFYSRAFITYMDRPRIGIAVAFIILMRTGEAMLSSMVSPFIVDLGIKVHYGWISGGVGLPCSIVGAMIGGWAISRYSLAKTIWPFLLAQNLTNIVYMLLALHLTDYLAVNTGADNPVPIGSLNLFLIASVHGFDQLAGGLGTSVLTTFLMRTCLPAFKAAHFAVGTGLMNVSGVLSGALSGFLAEWVGYGYFFGISFLASIPGLLLIFFVPFLEPPPQQVDPLL